MTSLAADLNYVFYNNLHHQQQIAYVFHIPMFPVFFPSAPHHQLLLNLEGMSSINLKEACHITNKVIKLLGFICM